MTVPDNPIQIADAALYLSKTQPSLGITDPYELNETQLNAAVDLLKQQKPLIKKYWALASDEVDLFKNGDVVIGASWPLQTITLQAAKAPVKDLIPKEGATGWADTWMLSAHAKHPNCAYKWMQVGLDARRCRPSRRSLFGETPANTKACPFMDKIQKGSCALVPPERAGQRTSTRSSSGRRRWPPAATARTTAWTTRSGSRRGRS